MRSHSYDFRRRDLFQLIAPTLLPLTAFALVMHLGTFCKLLPKPRATLDVDRTILIHKAEASQSLRDAQVLLIGDSSCLIDINARQLTEELKIPVLNLGTLSYLGLQSHAALLSEYFSLNPGRVKTVVLLMHPEALRLTTPGEYHAKFLERFLRGEDFTLRSRIRDHVSYWLGFDFFRNRLLGRALPVPLGGAYGRRYGFSSDLEAYLAAHHGSLADPEVREFRGNPEYRLASQFEKSSHAFRAVIPPNVRLLVAITPVPAGYAPRDYALTREQILTQWQQWLAPVTVLTNVPAILHDPLFAKTTHLSEEGARQYTSQLAGALRLIAGEQ